MLDAQQQGGRGGDQRAAGLDDQLGLVLAEVVADGGRDGVEVVFHRRRFAGRVGGRIAAADIEALEFDAGFFDDARGSRNVALIGIGVLALAADVEAQAWGVSHFVDGGDDFGRALFHHAELDAEVIGLERLAGLEAGGDFDIARGGHHRGQLVELLGMVDGERADAELFVGAHDLALVLDRVVVVHHRARGVIAHQFHFGIGGDVERLEAFLVELGNDVGRRVALDRIGQQAVEALPEDLHGLVELTFREQKSRKVRSFRGNQGRGVRINVFRLSGHWTTCLSGWRTRKSSAAYRAACPLAQTIICRQYGRATERHFTDRIRAFRSLSALAG